MLIKGVIDEDFVNYKLPSMFISTAFCDFKCEKESGVRCCQNSALTAQKEVEYDTKELVTRYIDNPITKAVVFGGREPMMQYDDITDFMSCLRYDHLCSDPVVIYTGYDKTEISYQVEMLRLFGNVTVKFGRFVPNCEPHFDPVLGVNLASPNQYAEELCDAR